MSSEKKLPHLPVGQIFQSVNGETTDKAAKEEDIDYLLFKHAYPSLLGIIDKVLEQYKYSSIKSEIMREDWYWVAIQLAQKFEELKSNKEVMPQRKFEEFLNIDWEGMAIVLRKNQIEAKIPLETRFPSLSLIIENDIETTRRNIENHDKIPYNSLEHLLRRIESIKEDNHAIRQLYNSYSTLFSNYNLECHSLLYKMALDGSLFEEHNETEPRPKEQKREQKTISLDELKGQINASGIRFFAVMYVIAKLEPTLNEIQYSKSNGKREAAEKALKFVKKKYNLLPEATEETLLKYKEPNKWEGLFWSHRFKEIHHPIVAAYLKAVLPDKATKIESILAELNQSKKNAQKEEFDRTESI